MITSKSELKDYLSADYETSHRPSKKSVTWKYLYALRKTELYKNNNNVLLYKIYRHKLNKLSVLTGISIPPNVFGKGLGLFHYGTIIVNGTSRFGENCVIQAGVNIAAGVTGGDYIYFMPGCKVNQNLSIASHNVLASNTVVTKDLTVEGKVWGGIPAKIISDKGFYDVWFRDKDSI